MSHIHKQEPQKVKPYKIMAQTAGMAVCLFFVFFIIGKGIPGIAKDEEHALLLFLPLILLPFIGYIVSWFKELPGTVMMIAGGIILMIYFIIKKDLDMALVYGLPFIIVGVLFLLHISKRKIVHPKK